jgi:hypothetical protein
MGYQLFMRKPGKAIHFGESFTTEAEAEASLQWWRTVKSADQCEIWIEADGYREELTPAGPQLVIPGCERRAPDNGKPAQLSLFA